MSEKSRAVWSTAYINDLPDSAFACIDAGGEKDDQGRTTPRSLRHYPHHDTTGGVDLDHLRAARQRVSQQGTTSCGYGHLFNEHKLPSDDASSAARPPKDNIVRALYPSIELRSINDDAVGMPTLAGHFAVFNQWTEIDSIWEGRFMERIAPGAFSKTFKENRDAIRVLFQHGRDPQIGDKPLGKAEGLDEDDYGAAYAVPMLDTSYNRDLIPGLEAGLYGSSFRFRVMKEELESKPKKGAHNPDGLPERTITEAHVMEFGPVTFPAYAGATAGVRSLTDSYIFDRFLREPDKLAELIDYMRDGSPALPGVGAEDEPHSDEGSRVSPPALVVPKRHLSSEEWMTFLKEALSHGAH